MMQVLSSVDFRWYIAEGRLKCSGLDSMGTFAATHLQIKKKSLSVLSYGQGIVHYDISAL